MRLLSLVIILSLCSSLVWAQADYEALYKIHMTERDVHLEEVVITGENNTYNSKKGDVKTTQTLSDYLLRLNGLDMIARGVYAPEPVYRGMAGERAPVTINNMKIFGACTDKMDPISSYVALNNLQSIAVIDDAASGQTMNSTAGVIDLKTKSPIFNQDISWLMQAGTGYRSVNNEINGQFNVGYSGRSFGFLANATFRDANNYTAGGGEEIQFSQFQKSNVSLASSYIVNSTSMLKAEYIYDLATNVGYPALPMDVSSATGHIYGLTLEKFFSNADLEAKIYGSNIEHIMDDSQRDVVMRMDMPGWSNTYGTYVKMNNSFEKLKLSSTLDYYFNQSLAEMTMYPDGEAPMFMLTWPDVHKNSLSLSGSAKIDLSDKDLLKLSARIEVGTNEIKDELGIRQLEAVGIVGVSGNNFYLPSVSIYYKNQLWETISWNINGSYTQRQASVSEGFGFYVFNNQDNYDYLGDPRLRPEGSFKAETGLRSNEDNIQWNIQGFYYHMPNYIIGIVNPTLSAMTIGASGVKEYVNIDYGNMAGAELGFIYQPMSWFTFSTQAQYTVGVDNEGVPLPMVPPLKNTTKIRMSNDKFSGFLAVKSALAQNNPRIEYGEQETPSYAITSLGAQYNLSLYRANVVLAAEVDNLFDTYYWDHLDFNSIPRLGRSINLSLVFSYK